VFAVPTLPVAVGALAGVLLVGLVVAHLPVALLGRQARAVAVWVVAIVAVHALVTDVLTGVSTALRLLALVLAAAVVTATTRTTAMVAVVERVCAPLRFAGVRPARIGLVRAVATMVVPLLVQMLQLAHTVSEALDARGADDDPRAVRGTA